MMRLPLPQELAATFWGALNCRTGREPRRSRVWIPWNLFTGCFEKRAQPLVPHISQERAHHFAPHSTTSGSRASQRARSGWRSHRNPIMGIAS
jgi:hypothetical protein